MTKRLAPWRLFLGSIGAASVLCSGAVWQELRAQPAGNSAIPDFSPVWALMNGTAYFRVPGDAGPGPIMQRGKDYKHDDVPRVAETNNPILKPWAKKLMDINNQRVLAGDIPFYPTSRCWPGGVPGLVSRYFSSRLRKRSGFSTSATRRYGAFT